MAVGELFLSAFIQALFQQLLSPEVLKYASREGIRQKLDEWSETLSRIQAVLDDAEDRQDNNDRAVKLWLNDLKDLAYDVDDILDEFATEVLRRKLLGENQASTSKVRKLIPACCTCLTPSAVKINIRLRPKITEITRRFNEIVKQKDDLKLSEAVDARRSDRERKRLQPTSVINKDLICGREKDKENVVKLLLTENSSAAGVRVVSIVGMGGMGKTTLAQLVYNDEKLNDIFEVKAWVCVSEDFDVVRVTKAVLESVGASENCDGKALDWLQVKLKEKLQGKKFLVVMDDVWNEDHYEDWTKLRVPFDAGAPGSRILVTTRSKGVSSIMGTVNGPVYSLQLLSDDVCLSILSLHALDARDFSAFPGLKDIGEDIAKKCKGLALAAKAIGGLLRCKQGRDKWNEVLHSRIWGATEEGSTVVVPALMLSYHHLPSHLKRCFAYCAIFPKDYEFEEQQLILLWMAEGFILREEGEKQMEDFGRDYFLNLVSRSFFQQSSNNKSRFVMHDLINDLAQLVARDTCFRLEDGLGSNYKCEILKKARHSSYLADEYDGVKKFGAFFDRTYLRTFISLRFLQGQRSYVTRYVPYDLLPNLRCLRVLTISGYENMFELPSSIDVLKHLRYVDLSYTPIESLPESTTTLCNLQTLLLEKCEALKKLPSEFGKLVNLRHLNIKGASSLEGMPHRMGKLTSLQTLSDFVVGDGSCSGIQELGPLSHLRGTLRISRLQKVIDIGDANLIVKSKLDRLVLEWSPDLDESQNRRSDEFESVLNMLRPNNSLKELTIKNYGGTKFPTWLGGPSFPNMVLLRIENCKSCTSLPPVGQLASLKDLFIRGMATVKNVGPEFFGEGCSQPFKSLEKLSFEDMEEWEHWSPPGEFPRLRHLFIDDCPKLLGKLPDHLPSLENVEIYGCGNVVVSISSFPEHCKLQVGCLNAVVCKNKVDFNSLRLRSLSTLSEFTCGIEGLNMEGMTDVEDLYIKSCEEMRPLWSNEVGLLRHLPRLRVLRIDDCPRLVSLVAEEVEEQLPYTVKHIYISNCGVLLSLPKSMMYNNTCLERIELDRCHLLTHFARGQLPPTLKRLQIRECANLRILLDGDGDINSCGSTSLLERLEIKRCGSLKCLTLSGELPATLKSLRIETCGMLESVTKRFPHNSFLEEIHIWNCDNLTSLPMGLDSLVHLQVISISYCPNLVLFRDGESIPANLRVLSLKFIERDKMQGLPNNIHNLTSLRKLRIGRCPGLSFPEEGFPTNLTSLYIRSLDLNFNEALFDWGLHNLTSLQKLSLTGGSPHLISFPEMMLPASLTRLNIKNFPNLESLSSKGFQMLASLEVLVIENCGKLTSLPKDGLPPTILSLQILCCPLLKERCKKEGQERSKIALIPCVKFDRVVFKF